jgi:hypothetical protein
MVVRCLFFVTAEAQCHPEQREPDWHFLRGSG